MPAELKIVHSANLLLEKYRAEIKKFRLETGNRVNKIPKEEKRTIWKAAMCVTINTKFGIHISTSEKKKIASKIGKECRRRRGSNPRSPMSPPKRKRKLLKKSEPIKSDKSPVQTSTQIDLFPKPSQYF